MTTNEFLDQPTNKQKYYTDNREYRTYINENNYQNVYWPVALYVSETWTMTNSSGQLLEAF